MLLKNCSFKFIFSTKIYVIFFIIITFFRNVDFLNLGKMPLYVLTAYGFLILFYRLLFERKKIFSKKLIFSYLLIMSLIISCIINKFIGAYKDFTIFITFILTFLIVYDPEYGDEDTIKKDLYHISIIVSLLGFIYSLTSLIYFCTLENEYAVHGLTRDIAGYSAMIVSIIGSIIFCYFITDKKWFKNFNIFNLIFHFVMLFLNQQRTGIFGMFAALFCIVLFMFFINNKTRNCSFKNIKKYLICFIILFLAISLFLVLFTSFDFLRIFEKMFQPDTGGRTLIWEVALKSLLEKNILFGLSPGNVGNVWVDYIKNNISQYDIKLIANPMYYNGHTHSIYINQLVNHGIFGFICMIVFLCINIKYFVCILKNEYKKKTWKIYFIYSASFIYIAQLVIGLVNVYIMFNVVFLPHVLFFYYCGLIYTIGADRRKN